MMLSSKQYASCICMPMYKSLFPQSLPKMFIFWQISTKQRGFSFRCITIDPAFCWTGWWFQIFGYFHPYLGKMNPILTVAYFSNGLVQPPTSGCLYPPKARKSTYGCFRKGWYPQIIHFNRDFRYKPSILGYPYFWKHPWINDQLHEEKICRRWTLPGLVSIFWFERLSLCNMLGTSGNSREFSFKSYTGKRST